MNFLKNRVPGNNFTSSKGKNRVDQSLKKFFSIITDFLFNKSVILYQKFQFQSNFLIFSPIKFKFFGVNVNFK